MRSYLVVIATPGGDMNTRLGEAGEPLIVEICGAEAAMEAFDEDVSVRFAGPDALQADAVLACPLIEDLWLVTSGL